MADTAEKFIQPEPGKIAIRDADGSVSKIPIEDYEAARTEGARAATQAEYVAAKHPVAAPAAAAALGVGRGATFGFSDPALVEASRALEGDEGAEKTRRALALAKEAAPSASFGGEVAGMALPMFFGGGAGVAARAAGGAGEGLLARAGARALQAAPRAAAEGAIIGVGQQASEDTLENHKFAAENYLSAGFKGGALGVLMGTALAAGGGLPGDVAARAHERFFGAASRDAQAAMERDAVASATAPPRASLSIDPNAGLSTRAPAAESPLLFGTSTHRVGLDAARMEREFASGVRGPEPLFVGTSPRLRVGADAEEGLIGSIARSREEGLPNVFQIGKLGREGEEAPVFFRSRGTGLDAAEPVTFGAAPRREGFAGSFDAGLATAEGDAARAIGISRGKTGPRSVSLEELGTTEALPATSPIRIEAQRAPEAVAPIVSKEARSVSQKIEGLGDELLFKSTGPTPRDIRKLGATGEEQAFARERIGKTLRNEVGIDTFDSIDTISRKIADKSKEVGKSIRPMYAELNAAAARPSLSTVEQRFNAEVIGPASKGLYAAEELAPAQDALARLQSAAGKDPSFVQLHDLRVSLDAKLRKAYARGRGEPVPPGEEAMRGLRNILQDEIDQAAGRASAELGTDTAARIRTASDMYRDLAIARDISARSAANPAAANKFSLTDMIAMAGAVAAGHPVGAVAALLGNYVRKNFGNQVAANVLQKVNRLEAVQKASAKIDAFLNAGTKSFIEGGSASGLREAKTYTAAEVRAVRDAVANPNAVQANISQALGDLPKHAPKVSAEFATGAARIAAYLSRALPKESVAPGPVFSGRAERPLSDTDLRRASAIIETAADPSIVVDRIRQGRLTAEHVKTLKVTAPETYNRIRNYLTTHAEELKADLPVQDLVSLSILWQTPIAEVMKQSNINALQASFVGGSQAPKKGATGGLAPTVPQMAAGPVKTPSRATYFDQFGKGGKG